MGLYDSQSSLFSPSFGITEIIASLHDGGSFPSLSVTLKEFKRRGVNSSINALYYSLGNPSLPGDLFDFNLLIAQSNSFLVMLETNFSFCVSPVHGKWGGGGL